MAERWDVAIIGAGPAGLAAAIGARSAGAERVLLVDRTDWLGGILRLCVHSGFGAENFDRDLTGPEYAERYIREVRRLGTAVALGTTVLSIEDDLTLRLSSREEGLWAAKARAVVLAMGCREKTRSNALIPGARPAGVFTAGTAQRLMNIDGFMVGREVVIIGSGDVGLIMARRCTLEGARVRAVTERMPYPGGCSRNVVQCLDDYGIPLFLSHVVTAIQGERRVEGVQFAPAPGSQLGAGEKHLSCDTVLLSVGLTPEIELARQLGLPLDAATGGPVVGPDMQTLHEGVFACGNVVQVYDIVDWVSVDGERAGRGAARYAAGGPQPRSTTRVTPGEGVKSVVPQIIDLSPESGAALYCRVGAPYRKPRFVLRDGGSVLGEVRKDFALPSELVSLEFPPLPPGVSDRREIRIEVQGELLRSRRRAHAALGGAAADGEPAALGYLTCILCPASCQMRVAHSGGQTKVSGASCAKGRDYALQESQDPRRVFTYTVALSGGDSPRLPVRSSRAIRRADWKRAAEAAAAIVARSPLRCGQVLISDFLERGIDLIATRSAQASHTTGRRNDNAGQELSTTN